MATEGAVGNGREEALATYVEQRSRRGDLDHVIETIDDFCYRRSFMMNVGDEKGEILEGTIRRAQPVRLLELGAYCGYSALRTIRAMPPAARLWSIEIRPANVAIARRVVDHAGVGRRGHRGRRIAR